MSILLTNADKKKFETEFLNAICHPNSDKWQSKTLFLAIFNPQSSIVKSIFYCRLPVVLNYTIFKVHYFPRCHFIRLQFLTMHSLLSKRVC